MSDTIDHLKSIKEWAEALAKFHDLLDLEGNDLEARGGFTPHVVLQLVNEIETAYRALNEYCRGGEIGIEFNDLIARANAYTRGEHGDERD